MPRGDRTGPVGMGPLTGRRAGFCAGYGVPGCLNPTVGHGAWARGGRGLAGGGRGYRHWYYATGVPGWARAGAFPFPGAPAAPFAPEHEATVLKSQAEYLSKALEDVNRRLAELEANQGK